MPPSVHFLCLILTPSVESLCDIIRSGCRTLARGEDSDNRRIVQQRTNGTLTRLIVFYWIWLLFHVRKFSKGGGRSMWWGTEIENQASSLDVVNKKFIMMKISAMTVNVNACFQGRSRTLNISFSLIRIFFSEYFVWSHSYSIHDKIWPRERRFQCQSHHFGIGKEIWICKNHCYALCWLIDLFVKRVAIEYGLPKIDFIQFHLLATVGDQSSLVTGSFELNWRHLVMLCVRAGFVVIIIYTRNMKPVECDHIVVDRCTKSWYGVSWCERKKNLPYLFILLACTPVHGNLTNDSRDPFTRLLPFYVLSVTTTLWGRKRWWGQGLHSRFVNEIWEKILYGSQALNHRLSLAFSMLSFLIKLIFFRAMLLLLLAEFSHFNLCSRREL